MDRSARPASRAKAVGSLLQTAFKEWVRDRCAGLAAAMAFNALLVLASFFAAILVLAVRLFGEEWARAYVIPAEIAWLGERGAAIAKAMLLHDTSMEPHHLLSLGVIGAIGLIYGAEGFFLQVQDSLETIWNVRREQARILVQMRKRLYGLLYAAASAVIAMVGFIAAGFLLSHKPSGDASRPVGVLVGAGTMLIAFATFWVLTTLWFKVLPPVRLAWRHILPWTALIAGLHLLGRFIVMELMASQERDSRAALDNAIILTVMWAQYASMVFLYGRS